MSFLDLDKITVRYSDGTTPIEDFSFSMREGDFVAILGDSGAGKSTLLNVISGLLRPPDERRDLLSKIYQWLINKKDNQQIIQGRVLVGGEDVSYLLPVQRNIGLVMQKFNLYPHMTIQKNLEFPLKMTKSFSKKEREKIVTDLIKKLEISEDYLKKKPSDLSGGEQQRIVIGKMLIRKPKIMLFDEAFSNLDWKLRRELLNNIIIKELKSGKEKKQDLGVIFVTHILEDAKNANRILYMRKNYKKIENFNSDAESSAFDKFEQFIEEENN